MDKVKEAIRNQLAQHESLAKEVTEIQVMLQQSSQGLKSCQVYNGAGCISIDRTMFENALKQRLADQLAKLEQIEKKIGAIGSLMEIGE